MVGPNHLKVSRVGPNEEPARPEDPADLGEEFVLFGWCRQVMEDREAGRSRKGQRQPAAEGGGAAGSRGFCAGV